MLKHNINNLLEVWSFVLWRYDFPKMWMTALCLSPFLCLKSGLWCWKESSGSEEYIFYVQDLSSMPLLNGPSSIMECSHGGLWIALVSFSCTMLLYPNFWIIWYSWPSFTRIELGSLSTVLKSSNFPQMRTYMQVSINFLCLIFYSMAYQKKLPMKWNVGFSSANALENTFWILYGVSSEYRKA